MPSWLLYNKENIDRFVEKLVFIINKSIKASLSFQKITT